MGNNEPEPPVEPEPGPEEPEPEPEPEPGEPLPTSDDPLAAGVAQMDAPLEVKEQVFAPTAGAAVRRPGQAEVAGTGARAAVRGRHNWVPIGPRNVGGRVRAVAIDPANRQIMYTAPASGGVFKSLDAGESWFPLWHDEASLSMGALAISPSNPQVIWAGTGETSSGVEWIPGIGVLRSPDGGATWTRPDPPTSSAPQPILETLVHALAPHPTNDARCWAATDRGLFRTIDGGKRWIQFLEFRSVTDVVFATIGGTLRLIAVLSGFGVDPGPPVRHRPLVLRIDRPDDTDAPSAANPAPATSTLLDHQLPGGFPDTTLPDPLFPLSGTFAAAAAGSGDPGDGKLALYPGGAPGFANPVLYVAYANDKSSFFGVYRCSNLNAATPHGLSWTRLATLPVFRSEKQGTYNLALAVSPTNPNHLAFGMVELYLNENATIAPSTVAHWKRAQMWDLYFVERGHHADHHQLVFAPAPAAPFDQSVAAAGTIVLWDANDGGISLCANWQGSATYPIHGETAQSLADAVLPLPANTPTWRKRSHGMSATQMYDLTQHPRLPSVVACGFQDNGAFLATGGPSWLFLLAADGGFVAFDPDDPYRLIVTWQNGVSESRFPGRLRRALPLLGEGVEAGLWPRKLSDGFLRRDEALFMSETAFHPTQPGRVLTARRNRVYGTRKTTGDRWIPEPLGHGIEIVHRPTAARATQSSIEVADTPGARALGLVPQRAVTEVRSDRRMASRVRSLAGQPFTIPNGQQLRLTFGNDAPGAPLTLNVPLTVGPTLPAQATAAQLADYLTRTIRALLPNAGAPNVDVHCVIWPRDPTFHVVSTGAGSGQTIRVNSSDPFLFGIAAREYHGAAAGAGGPALPAVVPVFFGINPEGTDLSGQTLHFEREGGTAVVDIAFNNEPLLADRAHVHLADLVAVLQQRLPAASYAVWSCPISWGIRLTATAAGAQVTLSGNLVPDLTLDPGATGRSVLISSRSDINLNQTGTPAADRRLRVAEAGHQTADQHLTAAFLGVTDLDRVTMVELCGAIRRMIDTAGNVHVRCDLDLHPAHGVDPKDAEKWTWSTEGKATEFAFGPPGSRRVWIGDAAGRLYRSHDDGDSWTEIASPFADRYGEIEALAVRPDAPDQVVVGAYIEGAQEPTVNMLYRSADDGAHWQPAAHPIVDAAGKRVGVRALAFDPGAPGHLYAATNIGVFHSADGGDSWTEFDEGLPNARIVDLAYEPTTRMLRAGAWGRGVYERHLGSRPAKDVRLHIRSTALDDGTAQPYPGPDLLATTATPLRLDASPDIKQLRLDPRRGLLLEGVEFDEEIVSTDVREGAAFIAVQVHNRGAFTTSTARVAVLWAPADGGPPPLPVEAQAAFAAGAVPAGTLFGAWKVIADDVFTDPHSAGHHLVAPGYPRVAVVGVSPAFSWQAADLAHHTRIGLLALTRCDEDGLQLTTTDVLELVRTEAKAAYRECPVVAAGDDARTVIRVTRGTGFRVQAPTGGLTNAANGGAPFGLAATAGPVLEARFATAEPYNLSAGDVGFRLTFVHDNVVVTFAADEPTFRNIARTDAVDVSAVINRALVAADVPVRASNRQYPGGTDDAVRLRALRRASFTVSGTAGLLGLNVGAATSLRDTPIAQRGPWNLTPPNAGPRELRIQVTTSVEVRLGPRTPEFANAAAVTAAEVRAAINRQIVQGGLTTVVAEPLVVALSVRRSATEAAASRVVTGGYAVADLVGSPTAIAAGDRAARFRVVAAHDADRLTGGQRNFLYVRVANVGSVTIDPARIRLFELTVPASGPVPRSEPAFGTANQPLAAGESAIVEVPFDLGARDSGSRVFVLAVADTAAAPDPPPSQPSLDEWHRFSLEHPSAAIRELLVA